MSFWSNLIDVWKDYRRAIVPNHLPASFLPSVIDVEGPATFHIERLNRDMKLVINDIKVF